MKAQGQSTAAQDPRPAASGLTFVRSSFRCPKKQTQEGTVLARALPARPQGCVLKLGALSRASLCSRLPGAPRSLPTSRNTCGGEQGGQRAWRASSAASRARGPPRPVRGHQHHPPGAQPHARTPNLKTPPLGAPQAPAGRTTTAKRPGPGPLQPRLKDTEWEARERTSSQGSPPAPGLSRGADRPGDPPLQRARSSLNIPKQEIRGLLV